MFATKKERILERDIEKRTLEELARDRFGELTDGEGALLQAVAGGQFANCAPPGKGPDAPENNGTALNRVTG